jgi:hypothetical protein
MLIQIGRPLQNTQQKPPYFNLLKLIELRNGILRPQHAVHGLAVGTECIRVRLHREEILPSDPSR